MVKAGRILVLYDKDEFVEATFENCIQAAKYIGITINGVYMTLHRKKPMLDGRKLEWIQT